MLATIHRVCDGYRLAHGEQRASAVPGYRTNLGVGASHMPIITVGEARAVCPASNEKAQSENTPAQARIESGPEEITARRQREQEVRMLGFKAVLQGVRGARCDKKPAVAGKERPPADPTVCERCLAVFTRKTWRPQSRASDPTLTAAARGVCPACRQVKRGAFLGRVLLRGLFVAANEKALRRRIWNVAERARFTQPQRRLIAIRRDGPDLEVLTTSQELAHRIVRELLKAFRGRVAYKWSDHDGRILAVWSRDHASPVGATGA